MPTHPPRRLIALLLCGSGMCALIYQVSWLRELRLVFGASTPASAAVLAVFMGGLGYGSHKLSGYAERAPRPLRLYANLELLVALSAALTPLTLWLVRTAYVALGGTTTMGMFGGTVVRLVLSALVLLPPTFLMGGTLPAAARAAEREDDPERRSTALLYGANTLGAVVGAALSTFVLMEVFGTQLTLWLGCAVNALVAMTARALDRRLPTLPVATPLASDDDDGGTPRFALAAACAVGLVFLLLELVWYRMLAPLLGGSTYTFGLILAVALLGVGLGGLLYTRRSGRSSPSLTTFATTCALEALLVAIPYALGDRIAWLAIILRPFGAVGLWGHALCWTVVTVIVVLPAAVVAGYQFPLLIALLGSGRDGVARHVGMAYVWNTVGAIAGSLAGGFVILPWLSAPTTWRLSVATLALLGAIALALDRRKRAMALPGALVVLSMAAIVLPRGPTAVWRHTPIGTGRVDHVAQFKTKNEIEHWMREQRYAVTWEVDGRESSIALHRLVDSAFLVSGKSDGSALADCTTQVMSGMLGAMLHGDVRRTMVIGLGTGSTAGWLGALPNVSAVDVVEIEPAIAHVAQELSLVNAGVLDNPKVHISDGDAREVLLTTPERYDLVFSEPSNPYRAGIASLFTREFYLAVRDRLTEGGVFVQWVQGYEIDVDSVRTVYATLSSVFGSVASWRTDVNDLMLVARAADRPLDVDALAALIETEPFRSALMKVWRVETVEGVLAHHVASPDMARAVVAQTSDAIINTDDRNLLEFAVARALGEASAFSVDGLRALASERGFGRPALSRDVEWDRVTDHRLSLAMAHNGQPPRIDTRALGGTARHRYRAYQAWGTERYGDVLEAWSEVREPVSSAIALMVLADALAVSGRGDEALPLLARLGRRLPVEVRAIEARSAFAQGDMSAALAAFTEAFEAYRVDPWASGELMLRTLRMAPALARHDPAHVEPVLAQLERPFATDALRLWRERYAFEVALMHPDPARCVRALSRFEPNVPWEQALLEQRVACYERAKDEHLEIARAELYTFVEQSPTPIDVGLLPD